MHIIFNILFELFKQVPQGNNQWFATTPNRSGHQQYHLAIQNPHLQQRQDQNQRSGQGQIRPNFNQHSSPHMRQPANWYFENTSSTSVHHPPTVENMTSMQSSPYVRKSLANNRLQQPLAMLNTEESYGYQNYGFQPDVNRQIMPSGYDNRQLVQNQPVFIHNKDGQAKPITRPMTSSVLREPIGSQYSPVTTQVTTPYRQNETQHLPNAMMSSPKIDSEFQKKGTPQHLIKQRITPRESTQQIENKTARASAAHDKLVPHVDVQLVVDRHQGSRFPEFGQHADSKVFMAEIPQLSTQYKVKPEETERDSVDTSFGSEILMTETASVQPERKIPEEPNVGTNEEIEYQESTFRTTQVIQEIDVLPVKRKETSLLTPTSPTDDRNSYNQYRPSTPVAPEILGKVVYFQGKIDESHSKESSNDSQQNEIKMSKDTPLSIVSVQSQSPAAMISDDAPQILTDKTSTDGDIPSSHSDATEFRVDNATQVCFILKVLLYITAKSSFSASCRVTLYVRI